MMLIALSTMLLTTACSSEDDALNNTANTENTINKGYALPVTVNVTRQDGATRASFNQSTGKLEFSGGDKLFVRGNYDHWTKMFAGTLDYDAESGKFKGTIYTQDDTYKTYEDLFGLSDNTTATLLPAGYEDHGYLVINTQGTEEKYDDLLVIRNEYTLATSKADGVAQFSNEQSSSYSNGFALSPDNAILNFTITGLAASTSVNVSLTSLAYNITGTVTTDASGNATFAAGIMGGINLQPFSLTVGGNAITLVSSDKVVAKGKIYNIDRNASPLASVTTSDVGKVIGADGNIYANVAAAQAASTTACAIIAYVGSDTGESAPYNHGLAIAMKDAYDGNSTMWMWNDSEPHYSAVNPHQYTDIADALAAKESGSSLSSGKNNGTYPAFQDALANSITTETGISAAAPATGTSGWFMPSIFQWNQIVNGLTGTSSAFTTSQNDNLNYSAVNTKITAAGGVGLRNHYYWSSTEYDSYNAWMYVADKGKVDTDSKSVYVYVRAAFAF